MYAMLRHSNPGEGYVSANFLLDKSNGNKKSDYNLGCTAQSYSHNNLMP